MKPLAALAVLLLLSGCAALGPQSPPLPTEPTPGGGPVTPVGTPTVVADNLAVPWSLVPLESGSTLISERESALVKELQASGEVREVGSVPGVAAEGEGGLLGLATLVDGDVTWLYAYFTATSDNRIERFELLGDAGTYSLGDSEEILTELAKAGNHNGGRIKFGPDGMLYATVGDAGEPDRAQDKSSLNGKILRMTPEGKAPKDNPFAGSLVYSMGHRNPQGITWDSDGQLWAAEFGQDTWDEFNKIEAGGNYGWPIVEGIGDNPDFVNPLYEWPTDDASPSDLLFSHDTFFLATLKGESLWLLYDNPEGVSAVRWFQGEYGRIRDVVDGPDDTLWFVTNNTDGRGEPVEGDDKLWQVKLDGFHEG